MRRTLAALALGVAAVSLAPAPASASHPCLDWHPLTCAITRPCIGHFCT